MYRVEYQYTKWGILVLFFLLCAFSHELAPQDPLLIDLPQRLTQPSMAHFFGTDELGRDIFSRALIGFSTTMKVSLFTFFSSFLIGVIAGSMAAYHYKKTMDKLFEWIFGLVFSLPFLLVIVGVVGVMRNDLWHVYGVLSAIIWVGPARIIRAGILKSSTLPFMNAENAFGKRKLEVFVCTLIPMNVKPAFLFSLKYLPEIIGLEAGLSFLGLGLQPPAPAIGRMIYDGLNYITPGWWYPLFPSLMLFITILLITCLYTIMQNHQN